MTTRRRKPQQSTKEFALACIGVVFTIGLTVLEILHKPSIEPYFEVATLFFAAYVGLLVGKDSTSRP